MRINSPEQARIASLIKSLHLTERDFQVAAHSRAIWRSKARQAEFALVGVKIAHDDLETDLEGARGEIKELREKVKVLEARLASSVVKPVEPTPAFGTQVKIGVPVETTLTAGPPAPHIDSGVNGSAMPSGFGVSAKASAASMPWISPPEGARQ